MQSIFCEIHAIFKVFKVCPVVTLTQCTTCSPQKGQVGPTKAQNGPAGPSEYLWGPAELPILASASSSYPVFLIQPVIHPLLCFWKQAQSICRVQHSPSSSTLVRREASNSSARKKWVLPLAGPKEMESSLALQKSVLPSFHPPGRFWRF